MILSSLYSSLKRLIPAILLIFVLCLADSKLHAQALEQVENNFKIVEMNESGLSPSLPTSPDQLAEEITSDPKLNIIEKAEKIALDPFVGETETTLFDVYLGDKLKGAILADYTTEWVEISDPKDLLDQIEDLKDADRLIPLLSGKIFKRKELPNIGAVRFNLNTFSIIIDVTPEFLGIETLDLNKRIKNPEEQFSLQQRVSALAAGSTQGDSRSALAHRGIGSYGVYTGILDGAAIDGESYELTQASVGGIFDDFRGTGGLLQTQGNSFASSLQYSGIKFETAQDLFLDQDLIRGSQFEIFVPSRSRVEFYRDGRLISAQVLDFGLREVDTTAFPQGSYDVDIVIIDSFGSSTRQRKFFTKAGFLTSRNQPIYTFQAGSIRDDLEMVNKPVYQGGVRIRATDIFDLGASAYGSEDLHIATVESLGLYRDLRFGLGLNQSTKNDSGITSNLGTNIYGFNLAMNYTRTLQGGTTPAVVDPDEEVPFDPIFTLKDRDKELLFINRYANSYSFGRRMGPTNIRYVTEKTSGDGTPSRFSKGLYFEWNIIAGIPNNLRFQTSYLDTERGDVNSAGLLYAYRISNHLVAAAQLSAIQRDTGDETLFLTTLNYDEKDRNTLGNRGVVSNEIRTKDDPEQGSITSITNQANLITTGEYLETVGFIRDVRTDKDGNTGYGLSATSSFLVAPDLSVSVSHPLTQEAVLIAELESSSTESVFEILLNGQVAGTVVSGGKTTIGVSPYRTYDIKIRPKEGDDLVSYDSNSASITFFPGNVVKKKWKIDKVFIILGRLIDANGEPISRRRIKGTKEYTATEEDGSFQAEIGGDETLSIQTGSYTCTLSFDIPANQEYFLDLGDLPCLDDKLETLPEN